MTVKDFLHIRRLTGTAAKVDLRSFMHFELAVQLNWCMLLVTKVLYHSIFGARGKGFQGLFPMACC